VAITKKSELSNHNQLSWRKTGGQEQAQVLDLMSQNMDFKSSVYLTISLITGQEGDIPPPCCMDIDICTHMCVYICIYIYTKR
jgi:hypothetical protein